jgi:hypothetical protein
VVCAPFAQAISILTMNFQTFAELAFRFVLTPGIVLAAPMFAPAWASSEVLPAAPHGSRSSMR